MSDCFHLPNLDADGFKQILLKYRDDVGKVFLIGLTYILWIDLTFLVVEMVPIWRRDGEFDIVVVFLWQDLLKVLLWFF